jgi:hypothetical protein
MTPLLLSPFRQSDSRRGSELCPAVPGDRCAGDRFLIQEFDFPAADSFNASESYKSAVSHKTPVGSSRSPAASSHFSAVFASLFRWRRQMVGKEWDRAPFSPGQGVIRWMFVG